MNYRNPEVRKFTDKVVVKFPELMLTKVRVIEMLEQGGQIRRSGKSVKFAIVRCHGRKPSKPGLKEFLVYDLGSNGKTINHAETIYKTKSLQNENLYNYPHFESGTAEKKMRHFKKAERRYILGIPGRNW